MHSADTCILFIKCLKIVKKIIFISVRYHSETSPGARLPAYPSLRREVCEWLWRLAFSAHTELKQTHPLPEHVPTLLCNVAISSVEEVFLTVPHSSEPQGKQDAAPM